MRLHHSLTLDCSRLGGSRARLSCQRIVCVHMQFVRADARETTHSVEGEIRYITSLRRFTTSLTTQTVRPHLPHIAPSSIAPNRQGTMAVDLVDELCHRLTALPLTTTATLSQQHPLLSEPSLQQTFFPLMRLPVELRLKIYDFAYQDTINSIVAPPFGTSKAAGRPLRPPLEDFKQQRLAIDYVKCPPIVGALALLDTGRSNRLETTDAFKWLSVAHVKALEARHRRYHSLAPHERLAQTPLFMSRRQKREMEFLVHLEMIEDRQVAKEM